MIADAGRAGSDPFTRVAACSLALSPIRDPLLEGFSHFVTSMTAPIASGRSESPGGPCTHWKAPPCHGAHPLLSLMERPGGSVALCPSSDNAESRLTTYERHIVGHHRLGEALESERANLFGCDASP